VVHLTAWDVWSKWATPLPVFWYWAIKNGLLRSLFLELGNKYLAKNCSRGASNPEPRGMQVRALPLHCVTIRVVGKYCCYLYLFLINRGPSTGSITMYWALSCDVSRYNVTSVDAY
jgi:hypothetical protein